MLRYGFAKKKKKKKNRVHTSMKNSYVSISNKITKKGNLATEDE